MSLSLVDETVVRVNGVWCLQKTNKANGESGAAGSRRGTSTGLVSRAYFYFRSVMEEDFDGVELNVEQDPQHTVPVDGLDKIIASHVVFLPHVLRKYAAIDRHSLSCTGGRMALVREEISGVHSVLHFECEMCRKKDQLSTHPDGADAINKKAVWGAVAIGAGHYQHQECMALLNARVPSDKTHRKIEKDIGKVSVMPFLWV